MAIGQDTATGELLSAVMSEAATVGAMQVAAFTGITAVDLAAAEASAEVEAFMAVADPTAAGNASSKRFNEQVLSEETVQNVWDREPDFQLLAEKGWAAPVAVAFDSNDDLLGCEYLESVTVKSVDQCDVQLERIA